MISKSKLSKKEKAKLNREKRITWGFSSVNRIKPSKRIYNRKTEKRPTW